MSKSQDSVHISKHLDVRSKYSAMRRIFNTLLSVRKCGQPWFFVFDTLLKHGHCLSHDFFVYITSVNCFYLATAMTHKSHMVTQREHRLFLLKQAVVISLQFWD